MTTDWLVNAMHRCVASDLHRMVPAIATPALLADVAGAVAGAGEQDMQVRRSPPKNLPCRMSIGLARRRRTRARMAASAPFFVRRANGCGGTSGTGRAGHDSGEESASEALTQTGRGAVADSPPLPHALRVRARSLCVASNAAGSITRRSAMRWGVHESQIARSPLPETNKAHSPTW